MHVIGGYAMRFSLIVFQGPSASGKSSLQAELGLPRLVTWTSRPARAGEIDGQDYHFATRDELLARQQEGRMLELAEYQGNLYGISLDSIEALAESGARSVILEASGTRTVKALYPDTVLAIGIFAEEDECRRRLATRQSAPEDISRRLATYAAEIEQLSLCDLVIRNTDENRDKSVALIRQLGVGLVRPV